MNNICISVKHKDFTPVYATPGSAGADLFAAIAEPQSLKPRHTIKIPCGFSLELPPSFEAQVRPRSGLAAKFGITVLNTPGTIDSDYRGEVCVLLHNTSNEVFTIEPKMRIAQMIIAPVVQATFQHVSTAELSQSHRGQKGFGSSGL